MSSRSCIKVLPVALLGLTRAGIYLMSDYLTTNLRHLRKPSRLWQGRVPTFLPRWMRERIEVNVCEIHALMQLAQRQFASGALVLDAGAGEGRFSEYFRHTHYVPLDLAVGDETWNYGRIQAQADLQRLPIRSEAFDGVVCTQVLEHVCEPAVVVSELARVLKPDGHLYLSAPQGWHQHQKPYDFFRFTSFALRAMFERAGLDVDFIRPMGGYFWHLSYELQMMHYWLFPPAEVTGHARNKWATCMSLLVRIPFLFLLPLPLYYLDRLDRIKDLTLGYVCHCIKRA
jgi:2-polyprenyl-3-methyl-5-hydroxy-6-metoxy-1,4-benzoquinol methylase